MCVFRILFLLLLTAVGISAQSSPDQTAVSRQFEIRGLVRPPEFRADYVRAASPNGQNQMGVVPPTVQKTKDAAAEGIPSKRTDDSSLEQCYSIRTYRVTREDPQSDITRPAGYSECEAAVRFQMKVVGNELLKP